MTYAKRADANQGEILNALHQAGVSAVSIHRVGGGVPDVLAAYAGKIYLLEIKTEGGKLNKAEREFIANFRAPVHVVRTPQQALDIIFDDQEE